MDLFKNRIQPTIIHLGENKEYTISNKYFLNYNVVQIDWFKNNSLVLEDGTGIVLLESSDIENPLNAADHDAMFLMNSIDDPDKSVLDIPRIYFIINENFVDANGIFCTPDVINSFIISLLQLSDSESQNSITDIITTGNTYDDITIIPGIDFFINSTLADYLIHIDLGIDDEDSIESDNPLFKKVTLIRSIELPNYLLDNSDIQAPWVQLTDIEINNTDFEYYYNLNIVNEYGITEGDIRNFYPTFCKAILDFNQDNVFTDIDNVRYKKVLEYFANSSNDEALQMINMILGSTYSGTTTINTASSICNCSSSSKSEISTCASLYQDSMVEYLKQMLGSDKFYYDWFFDDGIVDMDLIRCLKYIIAQFVSLGLDLSGNTQYNPCSCKNKDNTKSETNYDIINKYDKVLSWVRACEIPNNVNKIKLYGSQFGELLPKLQFN